MVFDNLMIGNIGATDVVKVVIVITLGIVLGWFSKYFIKKIAKKIVYPGVRRDSPKSYKRTVSGVNLSAEIVQWAILIVFIFQALSILNVFLFQELLKNMVNFIPKVAIAINFYSWSFNFWNSI